MESLEDVRASLAILALADLTDHEETSAAGEARVARLLAEAGALSWPLVVDGDSGLILDGSHRARVLRRDHRARFVLVQRVSLEDPGVRLGTWCRIVEGVGPPGGDGREGRLCFLPPEARRDVRSRSRDARMARKHGRGDFSTHPFTCQGF